MVTFQDRRYKTLVPEHKLIFAVVTQARRDLKNANHSRTAHEFLADVGLLEHVQSQGRSNNVKKNR